MSEAFEDVVATLLQARGYLVARNLSLVLASMPSNKAGDRCEIDIVAVKLGATPEILVVECKSTFGSDGLDWTNFAPPTSSRRTHRYRMFWSKPMRDQIRSELIKHLGITSSIPSTFCLASASTQRTSHKRIRAELRKGQMRLFDQAWLRREMRHVAGAKTYSNSITHFVSALFYHPERKRYA